MSFRRGGNPAGLPFQHQQPHNTGGRSSGFMGSGGGDGAMWNAVPTSVRISTEMLTPDNSDDDADDNDTMPNRLGSDGPGLGGLGRGNNFVPPCVTPNARAPLRSLGRDEGGNNTARLTAGGFTCARPSAFQHPDDTQRSVFGGAMLETPAKTTAIDRAPRKPTTSQHNLEEVQGRHVPRRGSSISTAVMSGAGAGGLATTPSQTVRTAGVPLLSANNSSNNLNGGSGPGTFQMPMLERPGTPVKKKLFDEGGFSNSGSFSFPKAPNENADAFQYGKRQREGFNDIPFFVADEADDAEVLCRDLTNLASLDTPPTKRRRFQ